MIMFNYLKKICDALCPSMVALITSYIITSRYLNLIINGLILNIRILVLCTYRIYQKRNVFC